MHICTIYAAIWGVILNFSHKILVLRKKFYTFAVQTRGYEFTSRIILMDTPILLIAL